MINNEYSILSKVILNQIHLKPSIIKIDTLIWLSSVQTINSFLFTIPQPIGYKSINPINQKIYHKLRYDHNCLINKTPTASTLGLYLIPHYNIIDQF
jgi:hypothetical protein